MRIGKLRHRLVIEKPVRTADGAGGAAVSWAKLAVVRGSIETPATRERFAAQKIQSEASHLIRMRHLEGIGPEMRIRFGSRLFKVLGIDDVDERGRELVLNCLEEERAVT